MAAKDSSPMVKLIVLIGILIVSSSLLYFLNDPAIGVLEIEHMSLPIEECTSSQVKHNLKMTAIVYTWTNASDPCYQRAKNEASSFIPQDKLRYSIRSLLQFAPWLQGPIYIVTPGHIPNWLNDADSNSRIHMVDQNDILPASLVNSFVEEHTVEQYLHLIPNLSSDTFLHFKEDYLFLQPIQPKHLFTCNGGLRFVAEKESVPHHMGGQESPDQVTLVSNTVSFTDRVYGGAHVYPFLKRAPFPWSLRAKEALLERFSESLKLEVNGIVEGDHLDRRLDLPMLYFIFMREEGSNLTGIEAELNEVAHADRWFTLKRTDNQSEADIDAILTMIMNQHVIFLSLSYSSMTINHVEVESLIHKFYIQSASEEIPIHELPEGSFRTAISSRNSEESCRVENTAVFPTRPAVKVFNRMAQSPSITDHLLFVVQLVAFVIGFVIAVHLIATYVIDYEKTILRASKRYSSNSAYYKKY